MEGIRKAQAEIPGVITFAVEHHIRDGHEADAKRIFDDVTNHVKRQPGLVFRQVLRSQKDPQKVVTIVCWESQEAFERQRRPRSQQIVDEEMRHFDTMTAELYDVIDRVDLRE